ncbi:hypothetical protein [Chloroflexus sp.]|uniref:hypothetical protein n=1 Tax=Chloroflexus sp. TaxID=1904827 RepID=UPI0026028A6E|nr:hypothetical protein [uncultured Chloroflexus sp.]
MHAVTKRWLGWIVAIIAGLLLAAGLELSLGAGGGGMGVALSLVGGGIVAHWRRRTTLLCRIDGPRLRPLQISAFGLMALGVQWYHWQGQGAVAALSAVWPLLGSGWLPLALVVAGVGWLALLSVGSDCRDEQLLAAMGETSIGDRR